jgi:streptogramin lyase
MADARLGTLLAGYRIESLIGRGGMSVVYLAHHEGLERKAALKLLAPELAENEAFRQRFIRESRMAAGLDHPNVIPVYDAGEADGLLYIAMRYVRGSDLKTLLAEHGPLGLPDVVRVMDQLGAALDAAHAEGLVHRDVKPANVLLSPATPPAVIGHLYLADFGLTKKSLSGSGITKSGQFVGTIDYVAPEQIRSDPVDGRTDVYSAGCVLYECLSGEPPYVRDSEVAVMFAHLNDPPPKPSAVRPELPRGIDAVVAKAMAKAPDRRYRTAGDLAGASGEALRPALGGDRTASVTRPAPSLVRRRRLAIFGGAGVALVAIIAVIVALVAGGGTHGPGNGATGTGPASGSPSATAPLVPSGFQGIVQLDPETGAVVTRSSQRLHGFQAPGGTQIPLRTVVAGEGAIWIDGGLPPSVVKIDPASGRAEARVVLTPFAGFAGLGAHLIFAVGESSVWAMAGAGSIGETTLFRIDPATDRVIARIPTGVGGNGLVIGREGLWVLQANGTLSEMDVLKRAVGRHIDVGAQAGGLALAGGFLWVTNNLEGTVYRVDPETEQIRPIDLAGGADAIAGNDDGVWILDRSSGFVVRIDPQTGEVGDPIRVGQQSSSIAVGGSAAWVPDPTEGAVWRVDAISGEPQEIPVARTPGPTWVSVGEGGVWVTVG